MKKQKIIATIMRNVDSVKRLCLAPGCQEMSINSHLLQRNGILDNLVENGHLYETKMTDPYKWSKKSLPLEFKKVGISKAISHRLFCNFHDTHIFKNIESPNSDLTTYDSFLLFSYRVVCAELRKKEINMDLHSRVLQSSNLYGQIGRNFTKKQIIGNKLGIEELKGLKETFEKEIGSNKGDFTYEVIRFDKTKVYASAMFSPFENEISKPEDFEQLENVFIHIMPREKETLILLGYQNEKVTNWIKNFINSWKGLDKNGFEMKLTDLFALRIENWGLSTSLFESLDKRIVEKFISHFIKYSMEHSVHLETDFNLFEQK